MQGCTELRELDISGASDDTCTATVAAVVAGGFPSLQELRMCDSTSLTRRALKRLAVQRPRLRVTVGAWLSDEAPERQPNCAAKRLKLAPENPAARDTRLPTISRVTTTT